MSEFGQDLIKKIENLDVGDFSPHGDAVQDFFHIEVDYGDTKEDYTKALEVDSIELVDRHGGEGEGDQYWSVYKFTKGTEVVYIKFDGWYASYVGAEFESMFEVQPVEKVVTFYE